MRRNKRAGSRKIKLNIRALLIIIAVTLAAALWGWYVYFYRATVEVDTYIKGTNTDAAIHRTEARMEAMMRNDFPELVDILQGSVVIPGLRQSEALVGEFRTVTECTAMVPQGLAVTDDYIFISAYCSTGEHNSNLFMLDRRTGDFIKAIALKGKDHVGGLAYDSDHEILWVSGGTKGQAKAVAYTLKSLKEYDMEYTEEPVTPKWIFSLNDLPRNSYMTYWDNEILIGYYRTEARQVTNMERYQLKEDGSMEMQLRESDEEMHIYMKPDVIATTNGNIQSIAKYHDYVLTAKSYGGYDSVIQVFDDADISSEFTDDKAIRSIRFPQKLEQIYPHDGKLYCIFESAAYRYRMQPGLAIDRILIFNIDDLVPTPGEMENYRMSLE